eukprot:gene32119-16638_t
MLPTGPRSRTITGSQSCNPTHLVERPCYDEAWPVFWPFRVQRGHKVKPDDVVDAKYDEAARVLAFESKGAAGEGHKVKPDDVVDAKYDEAARVLAFESKGAAGERTLSAEEEASRDRIRLERLEKERLRRMRGDGGDDEAELVPEQGSGGGFAARRSKQRARDEAAEVK